MKGLIAGIVILGATLFLIMGCTVPRQPLHCVPEEGKWECPDSQDADRDVSHSDVEHVKPDPEPEPEPECPKRY